MFPPLSLSLRSHRPTAYTYTFTFIATTNVATRWEISEFYSCSQGIKKGHLGSGSRHIPSWLVS